MPALTADGVDLVDEDDARLVLLRLVKQAAHARCADADKHLDEVRTADGEERHFRLARNGLGKQRFAGARRADEQHALGNARAQREEALGVLQKLDNLGQLFFFFVRARHVGKCDVVVNARLMAFGGGLAEVVHGTVLLVLLAHDVEPESDQKHDADQIWQHSLPPGRLVAAHLNGEAEVQRGERLVPQDASHVGIKTRRVRHISAEVILRRRRFFKRGRRVGILVYADQIVPNDQDGCDIAVFDMPQKVGIGDRFLFGTRRAEAAHRHRRKCDRRDQKHGKKQQAAHVSFVLQSNRSSF